MTTSSSRAAKRRAARRTAHRHPASAVAKSAERQQGARHPVSSVSRSTTKEGRRTWLWTGVAGVAIVAALFAFLGRSPSKPALASGTKAPAFSLTSYDGKTVSLESLRGHPTLMYFSEGAGCDSCFGQLVELQQHSAHLRKTGLQLVSIMANPPDMLAQEAARFGLSVPIYSDSSTSVSASFGVLGKGMHANLPGHSFVVLDANGRIRLERDYPSMYVPADDIIGQAERALTGSAM